MITTVLKASLHVLSREGDRIEKVMINTPSGPVLMRQEPRGFKNESKAIEHLRKTVLTPLAQYQNEFAIELTMLDGKLIQLSSKDIVI